MRLCNFLALFFVVFLPN